MAETGASAQQRRPVVEAVAQWVAERGESWWRRMAGRRWRCVVEGWARAAVNGL
ncbi:hypothetical protein Dimus_000899, partial [Dionaea muscipula]